jgi:hypothetical protein
MMFVPETKWSGIIRSKIFRSLRFEKSRLIKAQVELSPKRSGVGLRLVHNKRSPIFIKIGLFINLILEIITYVAQVSTGALVSSIPIALTTISEISSATIFSESCLSLIPSENIVKQNGQPTATVPAFVAAA